ncbi:hypothetical protein MMC25_001185 [Agyrium rufum]|nr:hypothetical protein [Agyrium rufum]
MDQNRPHSRSVSSSVGGGASKRPKSRQSTVSDQSTPILSVATGSQRQRQDIAAYERTAPATFRVQPQPQSAAFQGHPEELLAQSSRPESSHDTQPPVLNPNLHQQFPGSLPYLAQGHYHQPLQHLQQLQQQPQQIQQQQAPQHHQQQQQAPPHHQHQQQQPQQQQPPQDWQTVSYPYLPRHFTPKQSTEGRDSLGPETAHEDGDLEGEGFGDGAKRKKGNASSQANEIELRRLLEENEGRSLKELAQRVAERRSEKDKQVFGMFWLRAYCKRSTGSVPRNRVFGHYATRCGNERVPPLNPASFGKLVRIIFPGIATRRLGVRGESKYHYVELTLNAENDAEPLNLPADSSANLDDSAQSFMMRTNNSISMPSTKTSLQTEAALFPSPDSPPRNFRDFTETNSHMKPPGSSMARLYLPQEEYGTYKGPQTIERCLQFPTSASSISHFNGPFELPPIDHYLPHGADSDAVSSLVSVYHTHCILTIDSFRYCKSNEFFESYKSLAGLLTVPGQRLLADPCLAPWVKQCNWLRYQRMMPVLEGTILSQVPPKVMNHMEQIRASLCSKISDGFHNQPQWLRDAVLGPAAVFVSLLKRMIRVHRSAIDLANAVDDDENRNLLWSDWINHLDPHHIIQNIVMQHGKERILRILTQEAREMLSPIDPDILRNSTNSLFAPQLSTPNEFSTDKDPMDNNASFVDRLAQFLSILPTRFPAVPARELLTYIDLLGNSISRNLTLGGAASLATWWRIKVFIDEMANWLAEKGGFLEFGPESMRVVVASSFAAAVASGAGTGTGAGAGTSGEPHSILGNGHPAGATRKVPVDFGDDDDGDFFSRATSEGEDLHGRSGLSRPRTSGSQSGGLQRSQSGGSGIGHGHGHGHGHSNESTTMSFMDASNGHHEMRPGSSHLKRTAPSDFENEVRKLSREEVGLSNRSRGHGNNNGHVQMHHHIPASPLPFRRTAAAVSGGENGFSTMGLHDDSGIGMGLDEEDLDGRDGEDRFVMGIGRGRGGGMEGMGVGVGVVVGDGGNVVVC